MSSHLTNLIETQRLSFLDAIREKPYDKLNKLVFADWLQDQDDSSPLPDFIRMSCTDWLKRGQMGGRTAWQNEYYEQFARVQDECLQIGAPLKFVLRHGLPYKVTGHVKRLYKYGPELYKLFPIETFEIKPIDFLNYGDRHTYRILHKNLPFNVHAGLAQPLSTATFIAASEVTWLIKAIELSLLRCIRRKVYGEEEYEKRWPGERQVRFSEVLDTESSRPRVRRRVQALDRQSDRDRQELHDDGDQAGVGGRPDNHSSPDTGIDT